MSIRKHPISIPVSIPDLSGNEERYAVDAIRSTWISSTGTYVEEFEKEFAQLVSTNFAISVCNGTVALHLAMLALDVRAGDEVLIPSLTFISTANAVKYVGATPVFVDIDPKTWCINPSLLEENITSRTKGIIAVDLYGHPADMDAINHIAAIHGLWVIEDAAEAHKATYKGRPAGSLARIGTFSFYGNKIFTCGEGGALTVNDPHLELRIRSLRGQGVDPQRRYFFPIVGYNFRLSNLSCSLLCAQLERAGEIIEKRKQIFRTYEKLLRGIDGIGFQPVADWAELAPWLFCITIEQSEYGHSRNALMEFLLENGVDTRPFFIPIHSLPPYMEESKNRKEILPNTDRISSMGMNLPTYTGLSDKEIEYVCDLIREFNKR